MAHTPLLIDLLRCHYMAAYRIHFPLEPVLLICHHPVNDISDELHLLRAERRV